MLACCVLQGLSSDELTELKQDIVAFFTTGVGKELQVASIYFEEINKREVGQVRSVVNHLYGVEYISDSILGLKFRIGPVSFFQVFYRYIGEQCLSCMPIYMD